MVVRRQCGARSCPEWYNWQVFISISPSPAGEREATHCEAKTGDWTRRTVPVCPSHRPSPLRANVISQGNQEKPPRNVFEKYKKKKINKWQVNFPLYFAVKRSTGLTMPGTWGDTRGHELRGKQFSVLIFQLQLVGWRGGFQDSYKRW